MRVPVIADLDLLVSGFDHIPPDSAVKTARECLLRRVDGLIEPEQNGSSAQGARDAHGSGELRHLWRKVKEAQAKLKVGACTQAEHDEVVETFFAWQRKDDRCAVLMSSTDAEMIRLKHRLLQMLRAVDVYVLERGAIEQYYPQTVTGTDKPSRAQDFCSKVATREAVLACCGEQTIELAGTPATIKEFDLIFQGIFRDVQT